jgi:hypothetical protein
MLDFYYHNLEQGCQTRGPANTWASIFKYIDVKQSGNESLIKIQSLVRGRIILLYRILRINIIKFVNESKQIYI